MAKINKINIVLGLLMFMVSSLEAYAQHVVTDTIEVSMHNPRIEGEYYYCDINLRRANN